jgi:hypothetical protein
MKPTTKRAMIAAAVIGAVSGILTIPDLITQILAACFAFVLILGVLLLLIRLVPMATWSTVKQRVVIWLVATGVGASYVFGPVLIRVLTR